jgi:hypothetical protein
MRHYQCGHHRVQLIALVYDPRHGHDRRIYGCGSQEQAAREAHAQLQGALLEGYIVESIEWTADSRSVTVSYVYDSARSARQL